MYLGDSLALLPWLMDSGVRAKLIVTSPPFALVRKKEYGNEDAEKYVDWFCQFVPLFEAILEPEGSLVIDIGGSWVKGLPVKSPYHLHLVLRILKSGFYLAQDFYHYNPARLPTPAEWVTVRRMRLKDAVNTVWWFVRDPMAPADNRRVLLPYSPSMRVLLERGYKAKLRPSGHDISTKFQRDRGGSIPPNMIPHNVLSLANTESNSRYLVECRAHGIKPHPARFPRELPQFFIKLLTDPGDLVIDPFAGSNVTGEAAEALGRKWIGIELNEEYVKGSRFRFLKKEESPNESPTVDEPRSRYRQSWLPLVST
jgi:site-specific DNA-methyltransferase (cytosine-N4-specific)